MDIENAVDAFGALAQETRLRVYKLLVDAGETGLPAGDIALALGIPQNTLSFHLNHLKNSGLIHQRRAGRFIIYRADSETMKNLLRYLVDNCTVTNLRKTA